MSLECRGGRCPTPNYCSTHATQCVYFKPEELREVVSITSPEFPPGHLVHSLPTDAIARKNAPVATGVLDYFPLALLAVAELSRIGNDQHNPGQPLHWDRSKSGDEADALVRHFMERGKRDTDGVLHSTKVAWRAWALLQKELEAGK